MDVGGSHLRLPTSTNIGVVATPPEDPAFEFFKAALARAEKEREVARHLHVLGLYSQSFVWSVRAAEILVRDALIAPHFVEEGLQVGQAIRAASRVLGTSNWDKAFAKIAEWYGPFDPALTEDQEDAWHVWTARVVKRRGDLVHGRLVPSANEEESRRILAFADRMATWFPQRFLKGGKHPVNRAFRAAIELAVAEMRKLPPPGAS